jgi:hypothetical protein
MQAGYIFHDTKDHSTMDINFDLESQTTNDAQILIYGNSAMSLLSIDPILKGRIGRDNRMRVPWLHLIDVPAEQKWERLSFKEKLEVSVCLLNSQSEFVESAYVPFIRRTDLSITELCFEQHSSSSSMDNSQGKVLQTKLVDTVLSFHAQHLTSLCLVGSREFLNVECAARLVKSLPFLCKLCCILPTNKQEISLLSAAICNKANKELLDFFIFDLDYVPEVSSLFEALSLLPNLTTLGFISPSADTKVQLFAELFRQPSIESILLFHVDYLIALCAVNALMAKPQKTILGINDIHTNLVKETIDSFTTSNLYHLNFHCAEVPDGQAFTLQMMVPSLQLLSIGVMEFSGEKFQSFIVSLSQLQALESLRMVAIQFTQCSLQHLDQFLKVLTELPYLSHLAFERTRFNSSFLSNLAAALSQSTLVISHFSFISIYNCKFILNSLDLQHNYDCTMLTIGNPDGTSANCLAFEKELQRNRSLQEKTRRTLLLSKWKTCTSTIDRVCILELLSFIDDWTIL